MQCSVLFACVITLVFQVAYAQTSNSTESIDELKDKIEDLQSQLDKVKEITDSFIENKCVVCDEKQSSDQLDEIALGISIISMGLSGFALFMIFRGRGGDDSVASILKRNGFDSFSDFIAKIKKSIDVVKNSQNKTADKSKEGVKDGEMDEELEKRLRDGVRLGTPMKASKQIIPKPKEQAKSDVKDEKSDDTSKEFGKN